MPHNSKTVGAALAATLLVACGSDDDSAPLRVIHAVADAPSVEVTNGTRSLVTDLGFKEVAYDPAFFGAAQLTVSANLPDGSQARVIGPADIGVTDGQEMSILAIGTVAGTSGIEPLIITNSNSPVTAGNARVQIVHGAASAPPVDVYVTGPMDNLAGAMPIAGGDTPFGAFSPQLEVPADVYRIRVVVSGDATLTPVFDSGAITLPAGADLLVIAVDNTAAGRSDGTASPITLLVADGEDRFEIFDVDTPADVRVIHAVPDLNGVDLYVNDPMAMGAPAIAGLDFPDASPTPAVGDSDSYLELPAGTINVLVTAADNPGAIGLGPADIELVQGRQYSVFASNTFGAGIEAFIAEDDSRSVATEARARIIHLAPSAGLVDLYLTPAGSGVTGSPALEDVPYEANTGYLSLAPGSYDVTVTLADTTTAAIGPATITLEAGGVYTAVARDPDAVAPVAPGADSFGLILLDDF